MKTPLELLKETEILLFSLNPQEALELKKKTINLLNKLKPTEHYQLDHQISQERKIKENFLTWLNLNCPCDECEEN
jgi:hypothetical protein